MLLWVGPQIQAMLRSELTDRPSLSRPIASVRQEHQRRSAASPNRSFKAPRCTGWQAEVGNAGLCGHSKFFKCMCRICSRALSAVASNLPRQSADRGTGHSGRRRPPSAMISMSVISTCLGISLSLPVQAWVSGRKWGQLSDAGTEKPALADPCDAILQQRRGWPDTMAPAGAGRPLLPEPYSPVPYHAVRCLRWFRLRQDIVQRTANAQVQSRAHEKARS